MTMMMSSSQFGLEDMEALLWGPSSPMADAIDSLFFHPDKEEPQEGGGGISLEGDTEPASPLTSSSLSSSSSPPPFYSPPPSPPAHLLHGDKTGIESDLLSFPLLGHPGQLSCSQVFSGDTREDALSDLGWMAEKVDLSDLDLDSLIGSCSPAEESPSSPEDLLASFDCPMDIDSLPLPALSTPVLLSPPPAFPSSIPPPASPSSIPPPASPSSIPPPASPSSIPPPASPSSIPPPAPSAVCPDPSVIILDEPESYIDGQDVPSPPPCVPEPQEELEIKSEPASPVVDSPSSPAYTLDLGSEVDVSESEVKPVVATVVPQVPKLLLSLSPTRIVLVLAPKNEVGIATSTVPKVIRCSPPGSPPKTPSRSRPYPEPNYKASPPSPSTTTIVKVKSTRGAGGAERSALKPPKDKKQKKMEQNKTAATRYRQKKRAENDALVEEHVLLERKNLELSEKAESMAREIAYLKELMEEVRMTRLKKGLC